MNGATAEPWLKIIRAPNNTRTINIGINQYFFLTFKKSQNSLKNHIIKIAVSLYSYFFRELSNKIFYFYGIFFLIGHYQIFS